MSNSIYPTLAGMSIEVSRTPVWSTSKRQSVSLREFRVANATYPRYRYKLKYEVLRQTIGYTEFSQLVGFFNQMGGDYDSFLFADPEDNAVTTQSIGTGNGSATQYQLVRTFGSFVEPVYDLNGAPSIYVNGVLQTITTNYTIGSTGVITFTAAPPSGQSITWTGSFYRRCVFAQSSIEFARFLQSLWEAKTVEFVSVKP